VVASPVPERDGWLIEQWVRGAGALALAFSPAGMGIDGRRDRAARTALRRKLPGIAAAAAGRASRKGGTKMKTLRLNPEQLRVESFPVQRLLVEESRMTPGITLCLPYTCPECPYTRNVLCG
jgi:hypothetical protein